MILLAEAERAKDIANVLEKFRDYDPDRAIDSTINKVRDLTPVLRELAVDIERRGGVVSRGCADDLELLQHSVAYTLQDIWTIIGRMPSQRISDDYCDAWKQIQSHSRATRTQSLAMRIETYCLFAAALRRHLRGDPPSRRSRIEELRLDIKQLRRAQLDNRRLITAAAAINELTTMRVPQLLTAPLSTSIRQARSSERVRPPDQRTMSPTDSNTSYGSSFRPPIIPPSVGSPPISPVFPTNTFSTASQASSGELETNHWAARIFKDLPSTEINDERNVGKISECYPYNRDDEKKWPGSEYEEILKIKFPGGTRFHYYVRGRDFRAKVACAWPEKRRGTRYASLPLNELHSRRDGSILYLCRALAAVGSSTAWAALKFPTIEFLIVFHCTFLALRSYDAGKKTIDLFDHGLKGETSFFSGAIRDNGYRHALRIYRDHKTGTLRLEAAVLSGSLKDTPIWTAFITHLVTSPRWLKRSQNSPTVYLTDLKRHIFSSEYVPHVAASGAHILDFDLLEDARGFEQTVRDLGNKYREHPTGN